MLRSTTSLLRRLALLALAAGMLLAAAGCASDDDSTSPPPATTASPAAAQDTADPHALAASDAQTLTAVRQTVAQYCAGHKATAGELTGAIATLESLYQIDPDARRAGGPTVEQTAVAVERRLRTCGAHKAARRVAKLTG